jgi:hypothetical protein
MITAEKNFGIRRIVYRFAESRARGGRNRHSYNFRLGKVLRFTPRQSFPADAPGLALFETWESPPIDRIRPAHLRCGHGPTCTRTDLLRQLAGEREPDQDTPCFNDFIASASVLGCASLSSR